MLSVMSSIIFDWYSRRYVELNLNFFILNPLPVPRPERDHPLRQRAIEIAGRLSAHDYRLEAWAKKVGVQCGEPDPVEKRNMIFELDAVVALLYGLNEVQLKAIFRTFHHDGTVDGEPWEARFNAAMEYYRQHEEVNS